MPGQRATSTAAAGGSSPVEILYRFRRWLFGGLAVAVLLYVGGSLLAGIREVGGELARFRWWLAFPVLGLTLLNYSLRFLKWHAFLGRLGVRVPWRRNLWIFGAGLAMVISPGKAGELLKPWLVREETGAPLATTVPALVSERLTDGIAMLVLAALSITTYAADKLNYVLVPAAAVALGLAVLASRRLSDLFLALLARLPLLGRASHKLAEALAALRSCLAPLPLLLAVLVSIVAWGAECVGYYLVFRGFGVQASLDLSTFLYAFATIAGGAMPGGLGVADGALGGGAYQLVPGITEAQAVASALLIRLATLWFGVGIGAVALFRVGELVGAQRDDGAP